MRKLFIIICLFFLIITSNGTAFSTEKQVNMLNNTNYIRRGHLYYDINSYKYNPKKNLYMIDVMEELDPGGDMGNIICPYGDEYGYITHLIYSTKYSPTKKNFKVKYKGFTCATGEYKYINSAPIEFYYNYTGVFYNKDTSLVPDTNLDYFKYLKKEINKPNEYNYFGIIEHIKNLY